MTEILRLNKANIIISNEKKIELDYATLLILHYKKNMMKY